MTPASAAQGTGAPGAGLGTDPAGSAAAPAPSAVVAARTGTAFATDPSLSQAATGSQYQQAVANASTGGQPNATTGAAQPGSGSGQPVQFDDSIRQQFKGLGLTDNQVAQVEALGLGAQDLQQAFTTIQSNPSVAQQIPDTPPAAGAGTGNNAGGGAGTQGGGGQQGAQSNVPSGPAAWNDAWRTKFQEAGAPPDLIQQLTFTGAMGADETQLTQSLGQLKQTVDTEISKFRAKFPKAYDKLSGAKMDKGTLYQVAAAVNAGQISQDQFKQIVDQAGMTPGKMMKNMVLKQVLPWTLIPGWGAIRFGLSPFFGGKDPISGEPIHLDFWNHGFSGWMDAAMAAGGAMSLAMTARGGMQLLKGIKAIDAAGGAGLVGNVAKAESLIGESGTMSLGKKAMSFLPGSQPNRAVTGIARIGDLQKGLASLPEGSVAKATLGNYLDMLGKGDARIGSNAGLGSLPFGLGNNSRGALPMLGRRNKPMIEVMSKDGSAMLNYDGRLTGGPELTALTAGHAVDFLPPKQIAGLMQQYGVTTVDALKSRIIAEAGGALNIGAEASNPLRRALGILRPGPVDDVLKAMANKPPSAIATAFKNPWVKFLGIGGASAGAMLLVKKFMMPKAPGAQQAQAGQQQQAQGGQPAAGNAGSSQAASGNGQLQLTAQDQQQIQQFLAMTPAQQRDFAAKAAAALQQAASQQMTPAQQGELDHEAAVLQSMVQMAQQGAGAGTGAGTGTPAAGAGTGTGSGMDTSGMNLGLSGTAPTPGVDAGSTAGAGQPGLSGGGGAAPQPIGGTN